MRYIDMHVEVAEKDLKPALAMAERLGWSEICFIRSCSKPDDFLKLQKALDGLNSKVKTHTGVRLNPSKGRVQEAARKFRKQADVILVGGSEQANREASECWEVDAIASPYLIREKDFMHQRRSGIDYVIARSCAERGIAVEVNFSDVLNVYGRLRAQMLGRIVQNMCICADVGAPVLLTSGARTPYEVRAPMDLEAFLLSLELEQKDARYALSGTLGGILERTAHRKDPKTILKGLTVTNWGNIQPKEKKQYGWY